MRLFLKIGKDTTCMVVAYMDARSFAAMSETCKFFRNLPRYMWEQQLEINVFSGYCTPGIMRDFRNKGIFMSKFVSRMFMEQVLEETEYIDQKPHIVAYLIDTACHHDDMNMLLQAQDDDVVTSAILYMLMRTWFPDHDEDHSSLRFDGGMGFDEKFYPAAMRAILRHQPRALRGRMFVVLFERYHEDFADHLFEIMKDAYEKLTLAGCWMEFDRDSTTVAMPKRMRRTPDLRANLMDGLISGRDMYVDFHDNIVPGVFRYGTDKACRFLVETFDTPAVGDILFAAYTEHGRELLFKLYSEFYH